MATFKWKWKTRLFKLVDDCLSEHEYAHNSASSADVIKAGLNV
jgi:hypothetical protein